jgi:hypothetical protein
VRDFRNMTAELSGEFEKTIAEAKDIGKSVSGDVGAMKNEVNAVTESVKRDLGGSKGTKGKSSGSSTGTTAKAGRSGTTAAANAKKTTETNKKAPASGRKPADTPAATPKTHPKTGSTVADPIVVASKDDPLSDFSLFAAEPARRERRVRRAVPAAIAVENGQAEPVTASASPRPQANGQPASNDALSRARQRRQAAGYSRRSA